MIYLSRKVLLWLLFRGSYPPPSSRYSFDLRNVISELLRTNPRLVAEIILFQFNFLNLLIGRLTFEGVSSYIFKAITLNEVAVQSLKHISVCQAEIQLVKEPANHAANVFSKFCMFSNAMQQIFQQIVEFAFSNLIIFDFSVLYVWLYFWKTCLYLH